jgi:hypothetical protein
MSPGIVAAVRRIIWATVGITQLTHTLPEVMGWAYVAGRVQAQQHSAISVVPFPSFLIL